MITSITFILAGWLLLANHKTTHVFPYLITTVGTFTISLLVSLLITLAAGTSYYKLIDTQEMHTWRVYLDNGPKVEYFTIRKDGLMSFGRADIHNVKVNNQKPTRYIYGKFIHQNPVTFYFGSAKAR